MRGLKPADTRNQSQNTLVAPHTGAWIETIKAYASHVAHLSHPTRVRGLKRLLCRKMRHTLRVAPHTGAWIETKMIRLTLNHQRVAPHTGAWIETYRNQRIGDVDRSHPTRVRGLKLKNRINIMAIVTVAPHTGAWIETVDHL